MDPTSLLLGLTIGLAVAGAYALNQRGSAHSSRLLLAQAEGRITQLESHNADLTAQSRQQADLGLMLKPVTESLATITAAATEADRRRAEAERHIRTLLEESKSTNEHLDAGVRQLVSAMSRGQDRGRWGEMQLEQLLSHSGLLEGTHFRRQDTREDGSLRPDLVVMLPGGGEVLVDAKFPWDAYFEAMGTDDPGLRLALLQKHARDLGARVTELSRKQYQATTAVSPDFVVLFLPLEPLLSTALDQDGLLLDAAFERKIVLATPTTMLGLLRTIHFGWQRQLLTVNAEQIRDVAKEFLGRLGTMIGHFNSHGDQLRKAIDSYNAMLASFDTRVVKQAERMRDLGVEAGKPLALRDELGNDVHHTRAQAVDAAAESRTLAP